MFLNIKSEYSYLNSLIKLDEYLNYGLEHNIDHLVICDINNTFGCYKFIQSCTKNEIKPVVGVEFRLEDQVLFLYAKNNNGLKRLYELNTQYNQNGRIKLKAKEEDIVIVVGPGFIIDELLKGDNTNYLRLFEKTKDVYLGFNSQVKTPNNQNYLQLIVSNNYPAVLIDEKNYLYKRQLDSYNTILAIRDNQNVNKYKRNEVNKEHLISFNPNLDYFKKYYDEVICKCNYNVEAIKAPEPAYPYVKEGYNDKTYLELLAKNGLKKRLNNQLTPDYVKRLEYELEVINKLGFASYFLIVWDIVKFAKQQDIYVGPSRGSVGGCLVAYSIGITNIDPIANNLLFERFLNEYRTSMPDIDLDFEDVRRNEIYDYIIQRFGSDCVCKIGTITRFLAKSAFRDVAKAHNVDLKKIDFISKLLNPRLSFEENFKTNKSVQNVLLSQSEGAILEILYDIVVDIEGLPRQTSIHAAGVIISPEPLNNFCALSSDQVSLQEARELEQMGLLKMDILALSNLTFIHQIVDDIKFDDPEFNINKINLNDEKTFKLLQSANTLGVFQVESRGMREALKELKPSSIEDIALVIALYRPGPKEYIYKYNDIKKRFKVKNKVDEVLKETSGIIVYQEQIMLIANVIANYNLHEADVLRKGVSKKDANKIASIKEDFIKRGIENGYDKNVVENVFAHIEKFANYGFNKAHAYGYAMIVYQMAYLKAHYPLYFYSRLFYYTFKSDKREEFLVELSKVNINLLPPSILYSSLEVSIEENNLLMGLLMVRGIGIENARRIIESRQILENITFEEIVRHIIILAKLSKAQIKSLVHAGAFDFLGYNRHTLEYNLIKCADPSVLQVLDFGGSIAIEEKEEYSKEELSRLEYDALDINLKYDLFKAIAKDYLVNKNKRLTIIDQIIKLDVYGEFDCIIKINSIKETSTKNKETMAFMQTSSKLVHDVVVFPRIYETYKTLLNMNVEKYIVCRIERSKNEKGDSLILKQVYE